MDNAYSPIKIYLAAPFEEREHFSPVTSVERVVEGYGVGGMLALKGHFEDRGVIVTSTWLTAAEGNGTNMATIASKFHECRCRAIKDMQDIDAADYFIKYKPKELHRKPTTGGHTWETGYAHAKGKPIIIYGDRESVFDYLPGVEVVTNLEALFNRLHV